MNAHSNTSSSPQLLSPPTSLQIQHYPFTDDHLALSEFDSLLQHDTTLPQLINNSCSSGYTSYGGSPPSSHPQGFMQRSVSSHSLRNNGTSHHHHSFSALFAELFDSDDAPLRRVYSAGDLQGINGMQPNNHRSDSPLSSESSMIIEGMSRPCRYSPEEKKIRIERYRSKRNQRNFNKKIKYACRKTLADSRPRIRGRFARNDEIDKNPHLVQWSHIDLEEDEQEYDNWVSIFDSLVAANLDQESQGSSSFGSLYSLE